VTKRHERTFIITILSAAILLGYAGVSQARENVLNQGDTAWMLVSSALVLLMLPGLALFYAGMVRSKNVLGTMMHSFSAMAIISIQWIIIGYSLSFGADKGHFWGGLDFLFLNGIGLDSIRGTVPTYAFIMFQGMFAVITPALISGALAERVKFSAYMVFILLWSTLVYDPIAHWVWGPGGWLAELGTADFAGGIVVHISSGISALAAIKVLGARRGFLKEMLIPHNLGMALLGAGLLWFGWFGFNAGSALAAGTSAALAFTNTHLAAAAGALAWMVSEWAHQGKPSALGLASGLVAGLATVTPAVGFVTPLWALVIGLIAGVLCYKAILLKNRYHYDDSLDVFGIHGVGGIFGTLAAGIFGTIGIKGIIAGNIHQFLVQLLGVAAAGAYAFVVTLIIVLVLDKVMGLRVEAEEEIIGLDRTQHGEVGYSF